MYANGAPIENSNSRANSAIYVLQKRLSHNIHRRWLAGPNLESGGALIKQHAKAVGGAASGRSGPDQQRRFSRPINHVINRSRPGDVKSAFIKW